MLINLLKLQKKYFKSSKDFLTVHLPVTFSLFALLLFLFKIKDLWKLETAKRSKLRKTEKFF